MKKTFFKIIIVFVCLLTVVSCTSSKKIAYLEKTSELSSELKFETTLQPDDQLMILVNSENPEIAAPYNLKSVSIQGTNETGITQERMQNYILDQEGNIDFPLIGKINLLGLNRNQASEKIKNILKNGYINDPSIYLRLLNFKISVLGEVNKPGVYPVQGERVTLIEALALAGDLTIYGKRNSILLIREKNGAKTYEKIDITNTDFINSKNYYLSQNDVIYVEPNKTKVNSSAVGPNLTIGISALSLVVTILALTLK
jgi:polysaccharide export outer membrane protein